jgi:hypothetical protein
VLGWNSAADAIENKTPNDSAYFTVSAFIETVLDDTSASAALTTLGGTATGQAVFTAASASAGLSALSGAPLANPTFTGTPAAPTQVITDSSTALATTAWVKGLFTPIRASLTTDVALNNTANYFDGPTINQGTSGTWFVSGKVTIRDTGSSASIMAKLWDGTTVIDSGVTVTQGGGNQSTIALSGYITTPAGNLRISCRDVTATTGQIVWNNSSNSHDSTITAIRIG